jgi:hypothetical protein
MYKFICDSTTTKSVFAPTTVVQGKLTQADIIKTFELETWDAEMRPNFSQDGHRIDNGNHIAKVVKGVNYTTNYPKILCPQVTDSFSPIQYREGVNWLTHFVDEELCLLDSALIIDDTDFAVTCRLTAQEETIIEGDTVITYLVTSLGFGPGTYRQIGFTTLRPICMNTLRAGQLIAAKDASKHFTLTSSSGFNEAKRVINLSNQRFGDAVTDYKRWSEVKLTPNQVDTVFQVSLRLTDKDEEEYTSYDSKLLAQLEEAYRNSPGMEMFGLDNTAWRAFNAVTYVAGHMGSDDEKRHRNARSFGGAMTKRSEKVLQEYARAR